MGSRELALIVAFFLIAPAALAAPTAAQKETARRLMDDGKEKTRAGDLPRALEAYARAHELMHVPTTGLALAKAHLILGHLVEARDVALEVTRMPHEPGEPPIFEQSRQRARELEAGVKPRIPLLKIIIKGGPATSVAVDETGIASSLVGTPVAVNPGKRVVIARGADGAEQRGEIEIGEKESREIELTLPEAKAPPAAQQTPAVQTPSKAAPSGADESAGGERTGFANVLVYGGFGIAAVGIAAGSVTGVMAFSAAGKVTPQCANNVCDPAAQNDLDRAKSMATFSTIGFAAGGAGAALGVVGLLLPRSHAAEAERARAGAASTAFWIGPASAGVRGTF